MKHWTFQTLVVKVLQSIFLKINAYQNSNNQQILSILSLLLSSVANDINDNDPSFTRSISQQSCVVI